jgi:HK97 family phage major capsid protein
MAVLELETFQTTLKTWQGNIEASINTLITASGDKAETARKALETELDGVKKNINSISEQLKTLDARRIPGLKDELEKKKFDFGMFSGAMVKEHLSRKGDLGGGIGDPWRDAGYEKEMISKHMEMRLKDATTGANNAITGAGGGYLIPDEVTNEFVDMVLQKMPMVDLGINVIRGLTGDLPVPIKTSRTTAYMVGENSKPPVSNVQYGEIVLRPKKVAAFTKQSNRLIYQSRGVSDKIIRDDLVYTMKKKMEQMLISGNGAGFQPKGIYQFIGAGSTASSVGVNGVKAQADSRFRIDDASKMITDLECADELSTPGGKWGFLMHPRVKMGMKRERITQWNGQASNNGQPILPMNLLMTDKIMEDQIGFKIGNTTLVPSNQTGPTGASSASTTCSTVIFANWDLFWMGLWRDFVMKVSDVASDGATGSALLDDQIYIVAFSEFDTQLMRQTAVTAATGCETTESLWPTGL